MPSSHGAKRSASQRKSSVANTAGGLKKLRSSVNISPVPRGGAARLARVAHNHKVVGSNPTPATKKDFELVSEPFLFHDIRNEK